VWYSVIITTAITVTGADCNCHIASVITMSPAAAATAAAALTVHCFIAVCVNIAFLLISIMPTNTDTRRYILPIPCIAQKYTTGAKLI